MNRDKVEQSVERLFDEERLRHEERLLRLDCLDAALRATPKGPDYEARFVGMAESILAFVTGATKH